MTPIKFSHDLFCLLSSHVALSRRRASHLNAVGFPQWVNKHIRFSDLRSGTHLARDVPRWITPSSFSRSQHLRNMRLVVRVKGIHKKIKVLRPVPFYANSNKPQHLVGKDPEINVKMLTGLTCCAIGGMHSSGSVAD